MRYNPALQKWEGNDSALDAFADIKPTKPLLIAPTARTPHRTTSTGGATSLDEPHIVGNMKFVPELMTWVSLEPEIDVFEGMADDEESTTSDSASINRLVSTETDRLVSSATSATSSGSTVEVPEKVRIQCKEAEERHRREMKGWKLGRASCVMEQEERDRRDSKRLWEIRELAIKSAGGRA